MSQKLEISKSKTELKELKHTRDKIEEQLELVTKKENDFLETRKN